MTGAFVLRSNNKSDEGLTPVIFILGHRKNGVFICSDAAPLWVFSFTDYLKTIGVVVAVVIHVSQFGFLKWGPPGGVRGTSENWREDSKNIYSLSTGSLIVFSN